MSVTTVTTSTALWFNFGEGEVDGNVVAHPGEYWMKTSFSTEDPWQSVYAEGSCEVASSY